MFADQIQLPSNNQFILETHSEHLVLRLQRLVRRGRLKPSDIAILYVDRDPTGERTGASVRHLRLDDEGDFIDEWPGGFFEESFEEIFDL
jgi:predicted ATPase